MNRIPASDIQHSRENFIMADRILTLLVTKETQNSRVIINSKRFIDVLVHEEYANYVTG